jgi:hypothetical protein
MITFVLLQVFSFIMRQTTGNAKDCELLYYIYIISRKQASLLI